MVVTESLCKFCNTYKFAALGFHETEPPCEDLYEAEYMKSEFERFVSKEFEYLLKLKETGRFKAEDQCTFERFEKLIHGGNADLYESEYQKFKENRYRSIISPSSHFGGRPLGEILDGAEACVFCRQVSESFREWSSQMFKQNDPDILNSAAFFRFSAHSCNPRGFNLRFSVSLRVPKPSTQRSAELATLELPKASIYVDRYRSILQFQKCDPQPVNVKDFCNGGSLFDWERTCPKQLPFGGRLRPLVANTLLFRRWKEACAKNHDDMCMPSVEDRLPWLRLVDVQKRCVVDCSLDAEKRYYCAANDEVGFSYAALSYVWGKNTLCQCGKTMPELENSTEHRFYEPSSLTGEMVLSTIDNAIDLARELGERYLWVDCLCIRQDDEADKENSIPHMNVIYGCASVTIVAASGVDADAGLPGVKCTSATRRQQTPFHIKGVSLLQTLDEWQETDRDGYQYLGDAPWCKRGWTLQEKLFSRRALIFSSKQVYWECQRATWCEDGVWETENSPTVYRSCFGDAGNKFRRPWSSDVYREDDSKYYPFPSTLYRDLVEEYSGRALSNNSDGLDAFAGILSFLGKEAGERFIWALPTSFLRDALLWGAGEVMRRRLDFCTVRHRSSNDGNRIMTKLCEFPSWSWLGWVGKVHRHYPQGNVTLHYLDDNGTIVRAPGDYRNGDPDVTQVITLKDISETILALNIASNILFFWSDTAELHVRYEPVNEFEPSEVFLSHNGEDLCELFWTHRPAPGLGHDELAEFVVVGEVDADELVVLLLVDRKDSGVMYRRGLGEVFRSDWIKLGNPVRKMICLG